MLGPKPVSQGSPDLADEPRDFATLNTAVGAHFVNSQPQHRPASAVPVAPTHADDGAAPQVAADIPPQTLSNAKRLVHIDATAIRPGTSQTRKRLDDEEIVTLAESIREKGLMQPVLLRPRADEPRLFDLVAGYRRWRAACTIGLAHVPAIVLDGVDDAEALELALTENLRRRDLTVIEEAEAYRMLAERHGRTHEQIAALAGKSRAQVTNILRLLTLPREVRQMLEAGDLSFGHARALIGSDDPVAAAKEIVARQLKVRDVERMTAKADDRRAALDAASPKTVAAEQEATLSPGTAALAATLAEYLDADVSFDLSAKRPAMKIEAKSAEQVITAARLIRNALQLNSLKSGIA